MDGDIRQWNATQAANSSVDVGDKLAVFSDLDDSIKGLVSLFNLFISNIFVLKCLKGTFCELYNDIRRGDIPLGIMGGHGARSTQFGYQIDALSELYWLRSCRYFRWL